MEAADIPLILAIIWGVVLFGAGMIAGAMLIRDGR